MNVYTITIYDPVNNNTYDITSRLESIIINEQLDANATSFTLTCHNIYTKHLFNHIEIRKNNSIYLTGVVTGQKDEDVVYGSYKLTNFECIDWGYRLNNRKVSKTYLASDSFQGRPDLIIKDIISEAIPEFTTNNVRQCNATIEKLQYSYIMAKEAIENIMDMLSGWHYYIDKNMDFHFFQSYESIGTTFNIQNIKAKSLKVEYTGQEHYNKVWIVGNKQEAATTIDQYYTGDGVQRYFSIAYEPNSTRIYVNGVEKDSSLEANDNGNRDFLINKTEKVIYIPSYRTPFTGTIRVNYKPTKQFIDVYENSKDILTYGLMEKVVKDSNITNKLSARKYGLAEVKKTSTVKRKVSFESRTEVELGQKIALNIQSDYWNVQGYFLVTSIKRSINPKDEIVNFGLIEL